MTTTEMIQTPLDRKSATDRALAAFKAIGGELPIIGREPHLLTGDVYSNFRAVPLTVKYVPSKSPESWARLVVQAKTFDFRGSSDDVVDRFVDAFDYLDNPDFTPDYSDSGAQFMGIAAGVIMGGFFIAAIVYGIFFSGK